MSETIKNQNTLYRFISLRSPELTKAKNKNHRFVFNPENEGDKISSGWGDLRAPISQKEYDHGKAGEFFRAIENKKPEQTKKEALQEFCKTFTGAFASEKELENLDPTFFEIANWLALNKSKVSEFELYETLRSVSPTSEANILTIWDNLFYQITTNKSFYIKENCINMLVLQNVTFQLRSLSPEEALLVIKTLANARVVLPVSLFEDDTKVETIASRSELIPTASKETNDAQERAISKAKVATFETVIEDLLKVSKKYQKLKQAAYKVAEKLHQNEIKPIIQRYTSDYNAIKRAMCKNPRPDNYDPNDFCNQPDIEYPELPEFVFDYPEEVQSRFLEENLSATIFNFINENVDLESVDSIDEIIAELNSKAATEHQNIFEKTNFSEKIAVIGNAAIPVSNFRKAESIRYEICPVFDRQNRVTFDMTIYIPDDSYDVNWMFYTITQSNGDTITEGGFIESKVNGTIILSNMYEAPGPNGNLIFTSMSGEITFKISGQDKVFRFNHQIPDIKACVIGFLTNGTIDIEPIPATDNFIPKGFGFRQLGIADYKKVVSHVCCYEAGEVAHIENVMAREIREKVTTKTTKTETTTFESSEIESEKMSDTTSTERFEMQTEIAKLMREDRQTQAHANFNGSYMSTSFDIGGSYASNTSKEESNRQAVIQGKEMTQRAMENIVSRIKNEKTVKVTNEFTETNKHGFDNTQGDQHVSGVYRFINATYKNQIYNYGKRLMYEFMIPQPSKFHELGMEVSSIAQNTIELDKPKDPKVLFPKFTDITAGNYESLAAKYGASVTQYPTELLTIGKSFSNTNQQRDQAVAINGVVAIPEGYQSTYAKIYATGSPQGNNLPGWGSDWTVNLGPRPLLGGDTKFYQIDNYTKEVPVTIGIISFHLFNITITVKCQLTSEAKIKWQKETFDKIIEGYNAQLENYNNNLVAAKAEGVKITESNPMFYRQIEQLVLRKNCISYLIDDQNPASSKRFGQKMYNDNATFMNHQVTLNQKMDNYTGFAKFMEQAFDWNLMSYNFYPFYWGNRADWDTLYQREINDPTFRSFMQAGMARVVVTVKPGFEDAVMHYMEFGQIWNGGRIPVLGNPLYMSIVDELTEQEYIVEETWETVVPTSLIALQDKGVAINVDKGLPCGDGCENDAIPDFVANSNTLQAAKKV